MKRSKMINQQPKTLENRNIIYIKSATIEYPKNSNCFLYNEMAKTKNVFDEKRDFEKYKNKETFSCL